MGVLTHSSEDKIAADRGREATEISLVAAANPACPGGVPILKQCDPLCDFLYETLLRPAQQNNEDDVAGGDVEDVEEVDPDVYSSWVADSGMEEGRLGEGGSDNERTEAGPPDGEDPELAS